MRSTQSVVTSPHSHHEEITPDGTRFEHTYNAGPKERPTEQGRAETPGQPVGRDTSVQANTRMDSRSARARLPDGAWRSQPQIARTVQKWHADKARLGKQNVDVKNREPSVPAGRPLHNYDEPTLRRRGGRGTIGGRRFRSSSDRPHPDTITSAT